MNLIPFVFLLIVASVGASSKGTIAIAEGAPDVNDFTNVPQPLFDEWCGGDVCIPTVKLGLASATGRNLGFVYAFAKNFQVAGNTTVFEEFLIFALRRGNVYAISQPGGHPGGAIADPSLVIPKFGGEFVLVGGAEGVVVGGTRKFKHACGGYSTRLKLEQSVVGGQPVPVYYDELFFRFKDLSIC